MAINTNYISASQINEKTVDISYTINNVFTKRSLSYQIQDDTKYASTSQIISDSEHI